MKKKICVKLAVRCVLSLYCLEILKEKRDNPLQKILTIQFPKLECSDS